MRYAFLLSAFLIATAAFAQNQPVTTQDMQAAQEQMKKAQEMMNSPEFQEKMKQAQEAMQKNGAGEAGGAPAMPAVNPKILQLAMEMNKCVMDKVGPDGMTRIQQAGEESFGRARKLCDIGKRDEAMQEQESFRTAMLDSDEYKKIHECQEQFKPQMEGPEFEQIRKGMEEWNNPKSTPTQHICDLNINPPAQQSPQPPATN